MKLFHNVAVHARLPHTVNFCHLFISTQFSVRAPGFFRQEINCQAFERSDEAESVPSRINKRKQRAEKAKRKRVLRRRKRIINKQLGERMEEYGAEGRII